MEPKTILAVDDEEHILELLTYNLESNGYRVLCAESGERGLEILKEEDVDLVLLDLMLPGINGIDVLKTLRADQKHGNIPVIMLTAKSDEISKVLGLELGADDYIAKPFSVHELTARIKAVLRRTSGGSKELPSDEEKIVIGDMEINKTTRVVMVRNEQVELSLKEFELLYMLAKNRGRVFSRDVLLDKIWGYDYLGETRTVDVHIRNLRKKVEEDDTNPTYIKTVRGVGYKIV